MKQIKNAVYAVFATALAVTPSVVTAQWNSSTAGTGSGLDDWTIASLLQVLMRGLLGLVGFLGIIGFVISGILYLTAAGDEDRIEKAKSTMVYSIVGIIVALIGWVIVSTLSAWLVSGSASF